MQFLSKKGEKMNGMIAYCGSVCNSCPILLATREKNDEKNTK